MSGHVVPEVFDLLEAAAEELSADALDKPLAPELSVLEFLTQFYAQLFEHEIGEEMTAITPESGAQVGVLMSTRKDLSPTLRELLHRFRLLSKEVLDIRGGDYGGESETYRGFYEEFLPETLEEIEAWAITQNEALATRATSAKETWTQRLKEVADE